MKDQQLKSKVLEEIMALMDQNDGDRLKAHPKLAVSKVEVEQPEPGVDPVDGGEQPAADELENISPEELQKLLELIQE